MVQKCRTCQIEKPLTEFEPTYNKYGRGIRTKCRTCVQTYKRQWRRSSGDIARERIRAQEWRNDNRKEVLVRAAKSRAKARGLLFEIGASDIIVPELCPVLGIPLIWGKGKPNKNSPSIDRIDNNLGYTKNNIRVISHRANMLKSDFHVSELRAILRYMEDHSLDRP